MVDMDELAVSPPTVGGGLHDAREAEAEAAARPRARRDSRPIRVLLVDDHGLYRSGVRRSLSLDERIVVVGEAGDAPAALQALEEAAPDLVICDINLPPDALLGGDGIRLAAEMIRRRPGLAVITLSVHADLAHRYAATAAGVAAVVQKEIEATALIALVLDLAAGSAAGAAAGAITLPALIAIAAEVPLAQTLTQRETTVLELAADGYANKEIGRRMGISDQTVKNHISAILRKLGVTDRTQAVVAAMRLRILPLADSAGPPGPAH